MAVTAPIACEAQIVSLLRRELDGRVSPNSSGLPAKSRLCLGAAQPLRDLIRHPYAVIDLAGEHAEIARLVFRHERGPSIGRVAVGKHSPRSLDETFQA